MSYETNRTERSVSESAAQEASIGRILKALRQAEAEAAALEAEFTFATPTAIESRRRVKCRWIRDGLVDLMFDTGNILS